jgi:DNA-binding CsgD family transcriptional regulator
MKRQLSSDKPRAEGPAAAGRTAARRTGGRQADLRALAPTLYAAGRCADEAGIREACQAFAEATGHNGWLLACTLYHLGAEDRVPLVTFSGYHPDWLAQYNARGFIDHDPVVKAGITMTRPFDWTEIQDASAESRALFEEAAAFGIRGGFSVPLRGPRSAKGLLNLSRAASPVPDIDTQMSTHAAALMFGTLLMESVVRVADQVVSEFGGVGRDMSLEELKILDRLAAGQDRQTIAAGTGATLKALDRQMSRILRRLRSSTVEEALARASVLNLLGASA